MGRKKEDYKITNVKTPHQLGKAIRKIIKFFKGYTDIDKEDLNKDIHILNLLIECLSPSTSWEQKQGIIKNCELINKDNIYLIIIKEKLLKEAASNS